MSVPRHTSSIARRIQTAWLAVSAGAVFALSALVAASAQQDAPATLAFSPVPESIRAGEQATYVLGIANATRLFGADIEISFDPKAVAIVDADPAKEVVQVRIGPFLDPGFVVYNVADNAAGKLRVTFTQVAPKPPANGNGGILSFDVKATGGGAPAVKVSAALLARDDGSPQPVTLPSTGSTPAVPQGSPVPNPTQIPEPTTSAATAVPGGPTAVSQVGTVAATTTPGEVISSAPPPDGESSNWTVAAVVGGAFALLTAAAILGRKYLKHIGATK